MGPDMEPVLGASPEQAALQLVAGAVEHIDAQERALAGKTSDLAAAMVYASLMQVRGALAMAEQTAAGYEAARQAGRHERDAEITGLRQRIAVAEELCRALLTAGDAPPAVNAILAVLGGAAQQPGAAMAAARKRRRARHLAAVPAPRERSSTG